MKPIQETKQQARRAQKQGALKIMLLIEEVFLSKETKGKQKDKKPCEPENPKPVRDKSARIE